MYTMDLVICVALVLLLVGDVNCFGNNFWKIRHKLEVYKRQKLLDRHELKLGNTDISTNTLHEKVTPGMILPPPTVEHFLEQPLDHFDPRVKGTYKQRYWANLDYWKQPDGPVFLYIGGEGGLNPLVVIDGEHVELAKKYHALIVAVEHRFYGSSINSNGLELDQIQYLSSQQGLGDLAAFHRFASKQYSLTSVNKWICFGGSYPGALSAWFRIKYPHLVYGAVASSAPVHATVNFEGYNSVVAASIRDPVVNGSEQCAANINSAFKKVDQMLDVGLTKQLAADFGSCQPISSKEDIFQFASNLADVFMGTVQYNNEMPGRNVASLCKNMTKPGADPYQSLVALNKETLALTEQNCTDNSWKKFVAQVSNTTIVKEEGAGMRQWLYQTCSQFGYYQTCDKNTSCLFSRYQTLGPNLDLCNIVFGISARQVYDQVAFTNSYYGSDQPKGTRIIFVNGSIDPWHALSVLKDLGLTETAIYINGTAHCANMEPSESEDPLPLRKAREEIDSQIGWWLLGATKAADTTLRFKSRS